MRSFLLRILAALPVIFAAPVVNKKRQDVENPIPGAWIVRLNPDVAIAKAVENAENTAAINTTYAYGFPGFKGFAFEGSEADVDAIIDSMPNVISVEPDSVVSIGALTTQASAPWGLARISHRARGATTYIYDTTAGSGTYSYIIDTGINTAHRDFGGRATAGANFIAGETAQDANGHGTHVAGTVGGTTYGVAKRTNLIGVKVLGASGSGSNSGVLAGIDWAVSNARTNGRTSRSVINMSLGGEFSQITNDAVTAAVNAGIFVAVAAGNSGIDARNQSPSSAPAVCTVGATDRNDAKASFSNFGPVVDIFGPGVDIISAWIGSTSATNTISGTSMASPHIAGLGAYLIALEGTRTPAALCTRIQSLSTKNVITAAGSGSPNYLAYNGNGA